MSCLRLDIHPDTPQQRKISAAVEILHGGGIAAYPTDSVYALGCAIDARKAVSRLYRAKDLSPKRGLTLMVPNLSAASNYGRFTRGAYRLAKRIFPGPYVMVVPATPEVPRNLLDKKRRTVGIRVPANAIVQALLEELGRPLLTTTAQPPSDIEPCNNADDVLDAFPHLIDVLIDGGVTGLLPSTVLQVDPGDESHIEVLREGAGPLDGLWAES